MTPLVTVEGKIEVDPNQASIVSGARAWIANRIRDIRVSRGITQRELSNRMEVHFSRVCDLEKNSSDFKISTLLRAAWGLGISIEDLVRGCPGWKTRAAKPRQVIIAEYQKVQSVLLEEGIPERVASRVLAKLLE